MTAPVPSQSQVVAGSVPRSKNVQRSAVAAVLVLAALLPLGLSTYEIGLASEVLIFGILAMSIDILAGFAGRTSLGHGAIFGVATYVVVYANTQAGYPPAVAFVLGVLAASALAAIFALIAVRTSGVYFLLLTLALGMIVWGICVRWTERHRRRKRAARRHPPGASQRAAQFLLGWCWCGGGARVLGDVAVRPLAVRPDAARHSRQREPHEQPRL